MNKSPSATWQPAKPEQLAKQFQRLGRFGFWLQLLLLLVPAALLIYVLFVHNPETAQQTGVDLSSYLSYGSLLVMVFTTIWFYRYRRVGGKIADPATRPTQHSVERMLWVGLWAGTIGIGFSMLLMFGAVGRILMALLANPQTVLQVAPGAVDGVMTLSAIDAVSLMTLLIILSAELIVLGITLWLLFRVSRPGKKAEAQV